MDVVTGAFGYNGATAFSDWLEKNRATVGTRYSSEMARHFRWSAAGGA
jgi:hypothetical protein